MLIEPFKSGIRSRTYRGHTVHPKPDPADHTANNINKVRYHFDLNFLPGDRNYGGIDVLQIGDIRCEANYKVAPHTQWCHELTFIVSGEAEFFVDGKRFYLTDGSICICPEGAEHEIVAKTALRYTYIAFSIIPEKRQGLDKSFLFQVDKYFMSPRQLAIEDAQGLYSIFISLLDEFYADKVYADYIIENMLRVLLAQVLRLEHGRLQQMDAKDLNVEGVVHQAIRYVEKNHNAQIQVQQIAEDLGYSKYYLSHAFREKTGTTIQRYMVDLRMHNAKESLRQGQYAISEVADLLGYSNLQSFSRSFKKNVGMSPSEYIEVVGKNE